MSNSKSMVNNVKDELIWIDNLRAIATIGVILLHISGPLTYQFGVVPSSWWWVGNIVNSAVRSSVPIFLMISGTLLLPKNDDLKTFLKKRLVRILIPFSFWAFIHVVMNLALKIKEGEVKNLNESLNCIADKIIGGIAFHYWYIYMIIGIYLFLPIIGKWIRNSDEKEIRYFLVLWVTVSLLSQTVISKFLYFSQITYYFSGSLGFVVLGYYLDKYLPIVKSKRTSLLLSLLLTTMLVFTAIGTFVLSKQSNNAVQTLYAYFTPNVMVATVCIYLLFRSNTQKNGISRVVLHFISKYSYGIYLSHILVLTILSFAKIDSMFIHPIIGISVAAFLCISISAGIVYVINKLPLGKHISG